MNIIKFTRHGLIYHYLSDTSVDLTGEYVPLADAAALAAERDALRALVRRVKAMEDRLSDDEIYNRLADVYENGKSPELNQLLTDCREVLK